MGISFFFDKRLSCLSAATTTAGHINTTLGSQYSLPAIILGISIIPHHGYVARGGVISIHEN